MPDIAILHASTKRPLFTGRFSGLRRCLESAVAQGIDLTGADLRHANLMNAELDGANMKGARLDHANLAGANMSEAELDGAVFAGAGLQNSCLCFAALNNCDFTGASFGATEIAGARINGARFSTLSAFTLNFRDAETAQDCLWFNEDGTPCPFSRTPVAISGLLYPVILLDQHIQVGPATIGIEEWSARKAPPSRRQGLASGQALHSFISTLQKPLDDLIHSRAAQAGRIKN